MRCSVFGFSFADACHHVVNAEFYADVSDLLFIALWIGCSGPHTRTRAFFAQDAQLVAILCIVAVDPGKMTILPLKAFNIEST